MIFAAIGHINGGQHALLAVLDAIADEGMFTILHTGNAVTGPGDPNEIITLLADRGVVCVQGTLDRLVVRYSRKRETMDSRLDEATRDAVRDAHERLSSQNLERLRDWRKSLTFPLEELAGFLCHGSPGNPRELITPDTPLFKLQRQRETAHADIVVCGGSETPFDRMVDGTLFVHPGGLMAEDGIARYTLINTETNPWTVSTPLVNCQG
jgi:predicted phosphodiesterase